MVSRTCWTWTNVAEVFGLFSLFPAPVVPFLGPIEQAGAPHPGDISVFAPSREQKVCLDLALLVVKKVNGNTPNMRCGTSKWVI